MPIQKREALTVSNKGDIGHIIVEISLRRSVELIEGHRGSSGRRDLDQIEPKN